MQKIFTQAPNNTATKDLRTQTPPQEQPKNRTQKSRSAQSSPSLCVPVLNKKGRSTDNRSTKEKRNRENKVYVSSLPRNMVVPKFKQILAKFGPIQNAYICKERNKGRFAYGFIIYKKKDSALRALKAGLIRHKGVTFGIKTADNKKKSAQGKPLQKSKLAPKLLKKGQEKSSQAELGGTPRSLKRDRNSTGLSIREGFILAGSNDGSVQRLKNALIQPEGSQEGNRDSSEERAVEKEEGNRHHLEMKHNPREHCREEEKGRKLVHSFKFDSKTSKNRSSKSEILSMRLIQTVKSRHQPLNLKFSYNHKYTPFGFRNMCF